MSANTPLVSVTFGDVTVLTTLPSTKQVEMRVKEGQQALQRIRDALTQPGIKLNRKKGVPLYYANLNGPEVIIRELDGKRVAGRLINSHFVADMPN